MVCPVALTPLLQADKPVRVNAAPRNRIRTTDMERLDFDLTSLPDSFYEDPFPTYRRLRAEAPVREMPDGSLFVTRHADLDRIYRDTKTFSSDKKVEFRPKFGESPLYEHHTTSLVFSDPPLHTRVRKAIVGALAPRSLQPLEAQVGAVVDQMLDRIASTESFDGVEDYAALLPISIIGDLLCVPADARDDLRDWSLAILGALEPAISAEQFARGNQAVSDFLVYLDDLVARRRREMTDTDDDILSRLIRTVGVEDGLLHHEVLQNCIFLLNAGHETTTNLIASGIVTLIERPDMVERLRDDPAMWPAAVEEILRLESPNQLGNRRAVEACELGGRKWPAGTQITLCIGAANRDPDVFDDPDNFSLDRGRSSHFAFAGGAHLCAGLSVARIEGRIALSRLFERFPGVRIAGPVIRNRRARFRGFEKLPLAVT